MFATQNNLDEEKAKMENLHLIREVITDLTKKVSEGAIKQARGEDNEAYTESCRHARDVITPSLVGLFQQAMLNGVHPRMAIAIVAATSGVMVEIINKYGEQNGNA